MIHKTRSYCIRRADVTETAWLITNYTWTGCTGFEVPELNLLVLNDSFGADSIQEFVVLRIVDDRRVEGCGIVVGDEVESITVSWCSVERLVELLQECAVSQEKFGTHSIWCDAHHRCPLCA